MLSEDGLDGLLDGALLGFGEHAQGFHETTKCARLEIRDRAGKTALDYARGFGRQEAVRLLTAPATAGR